MIPPVVGGCSCLGIGVGAAVEFRGVGGISPRQNLSLQVLQYYVFWTSYLELKLASAITFYCRFGSRSYADWSCDNLYGVCVFTVSLVHTTELQSSQEAATSID